VRVQHDAFDAFPPERPLHFLQGVGLPRQHPVQAVKPVRLAVDRFANPGEIGVHFRLHAAGYEQRFPDAARLHDGAVPLDRIVAQLVEIRVIVGADVSVGVV